VREGGGGKGGSGAPEPETSDTRHPRGRIWSSRLSSTKGAILF